MAKITEKAVKALAIGSRLTDEAIEGFVARRLPSGKVSFGYQYTAAAGGRKWMGIGLHGAVTVDEARARAKEFAGLVAVHRDPAAELKTATARSENTVDHVLDKFVALYVEPEGLRSAAAIKTNFANHVRPAIGSKVIYDLTRADIAGVTDKIASEHPRMAHIVLALMRAAFNWWQLRDEEFKTPIVRGLVRDKTKKRTRVLSAEELADIWRALEEIEHVPDTFAAFVKVLFLTAARRTEVAGMHSKEIVGDRWVIPAERYKTKIEHVVPLVPAIKKLLPKHSGFLFGCASNRHNMKAGEAPLTGFDKPKTELDRTIALIRRREKRSPMPAWTFHDLRRTARTIMAELGIGREIAEACLGHVIGGVEASYNHHHYLKEKADALTKLAARVAELTAPPATRRHLRVVGS
jgi:integrase